jgi:hypothetical protein
MPLTVPNPEQIAAEITAALTNSAADSAADIVVTRVHDIADIATILGGCATRELGRDEGAELAHLRRMLLRYWRERARRAEAAGEPSWRDRWEAGAYMKLAPWQQAWGFLRHDAVYCLSYWPPRDDAFAKRCGLVRLIDPNVSPFDLEADPFIPVSAKKDYLAVGPAELKLMHGQAAIVIDLRAPIDPQIAALMPQIAAAKRRLPKRREYRLHHGKIPYYLAVLDARKGAGAEFAEIGAALYPDHLGNAAGQAKNDLRAALWLIHHETYLLLLRDK